MANLANWQDRWEDVVATTKMDEITFVTFHPWFVQERRSETALARLRMGHTRLTHGYLMSRETQPFCEACLIPLTVRHFLVECSSLVELRE